MPSRPKTPRATAKVVDKVTGGSFYPISRELRGVRIREHGIDTNVHHTLSPKPTETTPARRKQRSSPGRAQSLRRSTRKTRSRTGDDSHEEVTVTGGSQIVSSTSGLSAVDQDINIDVPPQPSSTDRPIEIIDPEPRVQADRNETLLSYSPENSPLTSSCVLFKR